MGFLDRFKSDREQELKDKSLVKAKEVAKPEAPKETKPSAKKEIAPVKKEKKEKKEETKKVQAVPEALGHVIVHPLVTEKASVLASQGTYVFVVAPKANRIQVRDAVKAMYGVTPTNVNIQNVRGKKVRFGRTRGQRNAWKKALVTLPKGKAIDVYEGA